MSERNPYDVSAARRGAPSNLNAHVGTSRNWLTELVELRARVEELEKTLAAIESLRDLKPGWDSYGGVPTDERAIAAARWLLTTPPVVVPRSGGGVQLEWHGHMDCEIAIGADGRQEE